jgi:cyanate permease
MEGIVTVVIGVAAFFLITDSPAKAKFLTPEQRSWATHRVQTRGAVEWDGTDAKELDSDTFKWKYVWRAFGDWQVWLGVLVDWAATCTIYGMSAFLPSIVANLGYDGNQANLLTIPMYACACILTITLSWYSDRLKKRSAFVIFLLCAQLMGYVLAMIGSSQLIDGLSYAGVFIATAACYPAFVLIITWVLSNIAPTYKRACGTALLVGLGNLSGAMAPNFYRAQDAPEYLLGHGMEYVI